MRTSDPAMLQHGRDQSTWVSALAGAIIVLVLALGVVVAARRLCASSGGPLRAGDFNNFYAAALAMRSGHDIYTTGDEGYLYPPLFAFVLQPLTALPEAGAAFVWLLTCALLTLAALLVTANEAVWRIGGRANSAATLVVAATASLLLADKVRSELLLMQTDAVLLLAFALGLRWFERRPYAAGLVLGIAANIKYLPLLLLPYLLARRRWKTSAAMIASFAVGLYVPALTVGWRRASEYAAKALGGLGSMSGLRPRSETDPRIYSITWDRSASLTSTVVRALGNDGLTVAALGVVAALAGGCLLLAWWMYRQRGRDLFAPLPPTGARRPLIALEWAAVIVAVLVFSPQITARHLLLSLPLVTLAVALLGAPGASRGGLVIALVVFELGLVLPLRQNTHIVDTWRYAGGPSWSTLVLLYTCAWQCLGLIQRATSGSAPGEVSLDEARPPG